MKEVFTYQISIKVAGYWRVSPEYPTAEEACATIPAFLKKFPQRHTSVTIVTNVRYVGDTAE